MSTIDEQFIYMYHAQDFEDVLSVIFELSDNNVLNGNEQKILESLSEMLRGYKNQEEDFVLLDFEQAVITLLDSNLLHAADQKSITEEEIKILKHQIDSVGMVMGFSIASPKPYSVEELAHLKDDIEHIEYPRLITTLTEATRNEDYKEVLTFIRAVFEDLFITSTQTLSWDESLLFTLYMHIIFNHVQYLSEDDLNYYMRNYAYRGIVCGAPVRERCEDIVYATENPITFVFKDKQLLQMFEVDQEKLPEVLEPRELNTFLIGYAHKAGDNLTDEKYIQDYVTQVYRQISEQKECTFYVLWLTEVVSIYAHLKSADLVDHNIGHELYIDEVYRNEMIYLLVHFGIGQAGGQVIVDYFLKEDAHVSLQDFFAILKRIVDLKKEVSVANCLELTQTLHKHQLLGETQELIEYHEEDGSFHWTV